MTNQELFALMDKFDAGQAVSLKLIQKDVTLELSKASPQIGAAPLPARVETITVPGSAPAPEGSVLTAPLVGTYYAAPAPDAPPFVHPGAEVAKGQTLCLIEAMKLMNEISAPCDCVVEELFCQDGQLVEFDAPLLRYRPL